MTTTKQLTRSEIEFTPRLAFPAFSAERPQRYPVIVEESGEIRVWDPVSRSYTLRHVVPEWHAARIRAEARRLGLGQEL